MSAYFISNRGRAVRVGLSAIVLIVATAALMPLPKTATLVPTASAQGYERALDTSGPTSLVIKNRNGRVTVIASGESKTKMTLRATSPGAPVEPGDVRVDGGAISVRERSEQNRSDITRPVTWGS